MAKFSADEARRLEKEGRRRRRQGVQLQKRIDKETDSRIKAELLMWWNEQGLRELCADAERCALKGDWKLKIAKNSRTYDALKQLGAARKDVKARGFKITSDLLGYELCVVWGRDPCLNMLGYAYAVVAMLILLLVLILRAART